MKGFALRPRRALQERAQGVDWRIVLDAR